MAHHNFSPGDVVTLRSGVGALQTVQRTNGTQIMAVYHSSRHEQRSRLHWRDASDYRLIRPHNSKFKEEPQMLTPKLFQTNEEPTQYGTLIGVNSSGKSVLEMKTSGVVLTFSADEITEVRAYTVKLADGNHYVMTKGSVQVNDVLINSNGQITAVLAIDTKHSTTQLFVGRKVVTEPLVEA